MTDRAARGSQGTLNATANHAPGAPAPVVLDHRAPALAAAQLMERDRQAIAFVVTRGELSGVVTVEDLIFALEWAGAGASVADATTYCLVEVSSGADLATATEAFHQGLRAWVIGARARHRRR